MDWREVVYGGRRIGSDIPKASNSQPETPQAGQERISGETGTRLSVVAFDASVVDAARNRLRTMHQLGRSWYELGKLYQRPAGTVQHWANGRGTPDEDTVEAVLKTRLYYVTLEPGTLPVLACPVHNVAHCYDCNGYDNPVVTVRQRQSKRERRRYWRPCLPDTLTADQRRRILEIAEER